MTVTGISVRTTSPDVKNGLTVGWVVFFELFLLFFCFFGFTVVTSSSMSSPSSLNLELSRLTSGYLVRNSWMVRPEDELLSGLSSPSPPACCPTLPCCSSSGLSANSFAEPGNWWLSELLGFSGRAAAELRWF